MTDPRTDNQAIKEAGWACRGQGLGEKVQCYRGLNSCLFYFGGFLSIVIVEYLPKPHSNRYISCWFSYVNLATMAGTGGKRDHVVDVDSAGAAA